MTRKILIVDDDPWIRRMVGTMMERAGHQVACAEDGREGLKKALIFRPDLLITDVMMPQMDGWALVRALRAQKELSLVPVIFLTALDNEEDRIMSFRLGADDYLAKPFRFEELELRVQKVLRNIELTHRQVERMKSDSPATAQGEEIGIQGDLAHLGLSSVLIILEMERKSGILVLRGDKATGRVFLKEGQVLTAFFEDRPEPRGAEAIYEMLTWKAGHFEFAALEVDMDNQVNTSTTHLLMEGARRIDEDSPEEELAFADPDFF